MGRLELINNCTCYVNILNIWLRFSALDDQKILQRTVFITANTQTLNALTLQLHNRKYLQHVDILLFLKKWEFLRELKSSFPFALSCCKCNVKFTLCSWRRKFTSLVPNCAVSSSVLNVLGFIYTRMSIFSIKHWNVIQIWTRPLSVRSLWFALWWSLTGYFYNLCKQFVY